MEKNVVNKLDYEVYNFHLPLSILLRGKKKKYIYSELEKRHPGFSEDWSFKTKYELNREGLGSKVLVMRKIKFAEYRNLAGNKSLCFENSETDGVSKWKLKVFSKEVFVVFLVSLVAAGIFVVKENYRDKRSLRNEKTSADVNNSITLVHEYKVENFLKSCETAGAELKKIEWVSDGVYEYFSCFLSSAFPENFENFENMTDVISYADAVPEFMVSLKDVAEKSVEVSENEISRKEIFREIREAGMKFGVFPLEENYETGSLKFYCWKYLAEENSNFFTALCEVCSKFNVAVNKLTFVKAENSDKSADFSGFSGELSFRKDLVYVCGIDLGMLGEKGNLFFPEIRKKTSEKTSVENQKTKINKQQISHGTKVGEIVHSDGTISVFYKNDKGKLICVN